VAVDNAHITSDSLQLLESLGQPLEPVAEPFIVAVSGLPGTGKSYVSQRLREKLPAMVLESDALRKILYPRPTYSNGESAHLFAAIHMMIDRLLGKGIPVILDATNLTEHNREYIYNIAERRGARLILVKVIAPQEVVKERLTARSKETGVKSDADWAVYQKLKPTENNISRKHYVVDTSEDISPVIDKIVRAVLR